MNYNNIMDSFQDFKTRNDQKQYLELKHTMMDYCKYILTYLKNGKGITICGSVGTGKTFIIKLLHEWLKSWIEYYNSKIPDYNIRDNEKYWIDKYLYQKRMKLFNNMDIINNINSIDFIESLCKTSILIIDDFGVGIPDEKEFDYNKIVRQFYYIINNRYEKKLPIIISTNYLYKDKINYDFFDAFGKQYAPLIIRRIQERSLYIEVIDSVPYHEWEKKKAEVHNV